LEPITEEEQWRRLTLYRLVNKAMSHLANDEGDVVTAYRGILMLARLLSTEPSSREAKIIQDDLRVQVISMTRTIGTRVG
jgi:hypothetical protein